MTRTAVGVNVNMCADIRSSLIDMASNEIMRIQGKGHSCHPSFPPACLALLKSIDGNQHCIDCGKRNPSWAAICYGALLCLNCSGHHRSLGVKISCVRSIEMDEWSPEHLLQMLEGGNAQLATFFTRHKLSEESCPQRYEGISKENVIKQRYKTKAAEFYRDKLGLHAKKVLAAGPYQSGCVSRQNSPATTRPKKHHRIDIEAH